MQKRRHVSKTQKHCRSLLSHQNGLSQSGKLFCQRKPNVNLFLENMNRLKRRGTMQVVISSKASICNTVSMDMALAHLVKHHQCWKAYTDLRATYALFFLTCNITSQWCAYELQCDYWVTLEHYRKMQCTMHCDLSSCLYYFRIKKLTIKHRSRER